MKKILKFTVLSLIISLVLALPVSANNSSISFNLVNESTGYKIIFPSTNFEMVNVKGFDEEEIGEFDINAILLDTPDYGENVKDVLLFQITSSNPEAHTLEVNLSSNFGGQTYYDYIEFVDGVASIYQGNSNYKEYSNSYYYGFKEKFLNDITHISLVVYDQSGEVLYSFYDINFMYEGYNTYPITYLTNNKQSDETNTEEKSSEAKPTSDAKAEPTSSKILVGGKEVQFEAYKINDNNYFKLRDIAAAVNGTNKQFEVTWDPDHNAIGLISNTPYTLIGGELSRSGKFTTTTATPTTSVLYIDGEQVDLVAYKINNYNYFKLRDIAKAFNIGIIWDGESNSVIIDTEIDYRE